MSADSDGSVSEGTGKRAYRSTLRQERSEQTKVRISLSAAPLFARQGYARTSVRQIAAAANVAVETIYSAGDKSSVFLRAFELSLRGTLQGTPLLELEGVRAAADARTLEEFLTVIVDFVTASNERTAPLWRAFIEGAASEPQLARAYADQMTQMRRQGLAVLTFAVRRGLCPRPAEPQAASDGVWAMLHPSQYELLVVHARWDHSRYRSWLISRVADIVGMD